LSAQPASPADLTTAAISLSVPPTASPPVPPTPPAISPPASPRASRPASPPGDKPWYAEPVILATMVVLIFVVIAFMVLIWAANQ
jgi:hypothetical protein